MFEKSEQGPDKTRIDCCYKILKLKKNVWFAYMADNNLSEEKEGSKSAIVSP